MSRTARRLRKRHLLALTPNNAINVTPFVDVMLVLLIVFMVTAPLLSNGVTIDLPKGEAPAFPEDEANLVISVREGGQIWIQEQEVESIEALLARLDAIAEGNTASRIYVRADGKVAYAEVATLMGTIATAGYTRVALVIDADSPAN